MRKAITFEGFLKEYLELLSDQYENITGNGFTISKEEEEETSMTVVKIKDSISSNVLAEGKDKDAYRAKDLAYQKLQEHIKERSFSKKIISV